MAHHSHDKDHHPHRHGGVDQTIISSDRALWSVKWSFIGLLGTALMQSLVAASSGSISLWADTFHNFGDATTALPLWVAFKISRRKSNARFSYGYGRVEDLAGWFVVLMIFLSAVSALALTVERFLHPRPVDHLGWVVAASILGFIGNEGVASLRLKVGKEIGSAALIADGHHARVDGWTSLAVLFGALGVWLGYPLTDPIIGFIISALILKIVWDTGKDMLWRTLDAVDPNVTDEIRHVVSDIPGVKAVTEIRARWVGHRLLAEVNIAVDSLLSVAKAHEIMQNTHHQLLHDVRYLSSATIHVDPIEHAGESHHQ